MSLESRNALTLGRHGTLLPMPCSLFSIYVPPVGGRLFKVAAHRIHVVVFFCNSGYLCSVCVSFFKFKINYLTDWCGWVARPELGRASH